MCELNGSMLEDEGCYKLCILAGDNIDSVVKLQVTFRYTQGTNN